MFIFLRLLLAHLVGDYLLQFNKIYSLKFKGLKGGIPHMLLILISLIIFSWPYLMLPTMWYFIFFIGITHLFQDWIKAAFIKIKNNFWVYSLDQALHIILIAMVFFTSLRSLQPPTENTNFITSLYSNNFLVLYLIALIAVTYNGFYLISNFEKTFMGKPFVSAPFKKWYGMIERALIVSIFFLGRFFFLLIPVVFFTRIFIFAMGKNKLAIEKQFISFSEITLSWTVAVFTGTILHLIAQKLY